uniref:ATPase family AAA domain-containing protein 5-like n=1 Tax=Stegastes partitus TaxID=144197 RepID=A0A3B4ZSR2_9TELE
MAGVVAMASVIEDFDTQPCKKSRKDGGSPVVKTITNYFSPVVKPMEKPFSPPRSSNIMDYFSRKVPSSKEKSSSAEQSKENCQRSHSAEKHTGPEVGKQPSQKRGRKPSKAARKLVAAATVSPTEEDGCVIVEEQHESKDSAAEAVSSILGNDPKCGNKVEPKPLLNTTELSPTEEKEAESSLCDVSMEVNLDEDSQLNNSTVRISFEDFVRSQSQDEAEEDIKDEQAQENTDSGEPSVQVSPRTVTIQAEVHAVSPKQEAAKAVGKLASIFSRRKGVSSPAEVVSSPPPEHGPKLPSLTVKRKSNVVLQEEDLELAVLESESTPKCSEAERKQFMAAFKQPSLDGSKTKPVKSQGKQKQPEENVLDAADKVAEDDVVPLCVEQGNQGKNAAKKKPARRGRNKAEEEKEATSISAVAAVEEHVTTTVEVEDKTEEAPVASAPSVPAVRRSRRQATVQPAPETVTTPPTSTPETRKSKRGVFVAEMVCPPDANQSPIRESKKRKQAKKLVEKAKVLQQSKKSSVEEKSSLRRSSRSEASVRRSYCEDETDTVKTTADIHVVFSFSVQGSGWRPEISESIRQLLMEELSTSNPRFPAQKFITRFLKRRTEHQQQFTAVTTAASTPRPAEPAGGKRKRREDDCTEKAAKKQRSNQSEESISTAEPEPTRRGSRMRRAQRSRLEEEVKEKAKPSLKPAPIPAEEGSLFSTDVVKEDVLWTDKYQPQHSSDIVDNTASVRRLHSWLKEWKLRADREERKKQKDKKLEEGSNDSDWDCGEDDSQDLEDMLCNTMLITGPTGVGKTAAVYACAQELGFKVFEVNASSQRSGRLILSQLKEATQSHQVDSQGVNAHKPTYFSSYGCSAASVRPGSSPRKLNSPRRVVSSPRKHPQSPRGAKKGNLAPTSLASFFKTPASKKDLKAKEGGSKHKDLKATSSSAATPKEKSSEEQSKKTATSLILFEEVDVIFDDDSGFLAAIKTFMSTTKRPVVLTTSDPAFSTMFDGSFEEIHFQTPSLVNVSSYLQLLCLAEDVRTDPSDISSLLKLNSCDIRQSLLQLQFWTRSAGGRCSAKPLVKIDKCGKHMSLLSEQPEEAADESSLPLCDSGCTENKLGLLNTKPHADFWELLRVNCTSHTESKSTSSGNRRRGVDLLYSNMEKLLPLPLTQLTTSTFKPEQCFPVSQDPSFSCLQPDTMPSNTKSLHSTGGADSSEDGSPVKVSSRMRKNKTRHHLPDQDALHSDSEDEFLSLCRLQDAPQAKEEIKGASVLERISKKPLTPEERVKGVPVSQCLQSIADFFDNMSYMDSSLLFHPHGGDIHRRPACAVVKDGMTDELGVETDGGSWMTGDHVLEIQAAVEALSFHKCRASVAESWDGARHIGGELGREAAAELSLPVAAQQDGYSFTQHSPCQPQLVQRRRDVMESLMAKGTFGNKPAAALDYLPIIRTICRSEQLKERGKVKRRFLHYLDAIHLGLEKSTLQFLAEAFP